MKKILTLLLAFVLTMALASCGSAALSGDPVNYTNKDQSVSIDLPTANEDSWVINDETADSILDMSDANDTVNIRVHCVSKDEISPVADDLNTYREYSLVNVLGDLLANASMNETNVELPEFINESQSYEFTMSGGIKGLALFMESGSCYYTYFVMAVDEAYDQNSKVFTDSILSLQELTNAVPADDESEGGEADGGEAE